MFNVLYGDYVIDTCDTREEAEESIEWTIRENWEHHPTVESEYSIEEVA